LLAILFRHHLFKFGLEARAVLMIASDLGEYALFQLPDEQVPKHVSSATALALF
jgi:hypothetical protein